jgi:DNA primase
MSDNGMSTESQAAGHKPDKVPADKVVTAACADSVAEVATLGEGTAVDFAHVKAQLSLSQVLDQLGLLTRLRGHGPQRRGACPLHRGDGRGRTFSVNLDRNVFQCFAKECGHKGDVIDLWAALHGVSLRQAALELVQTFGLKATPPPATEKRNG